MSLTSFTFSNRLESQHVLKSQNGIRKGGTARPGFWFLTGIGIPLPFLDHLPPKTTQKSSAGSSCGDEDWNRRLAAMIRDMLVVFESLCSYNSREI